MKTDLRIRIDNSDMLKNIFDRAYFDNNLRGKLGNVTNEMLTIEPSHEYYGILTDLTNMECRIVNDEIISGSAKFIIVSKDENGVYLKPTSLFCVKESEEIYSFY